MKTYRAITLRSSVGDIRTAKFEGKEHIVIPIVALVEGVIQAMNAPAPELVLAERFSIAPSGWNGRPVFLDHPLDGGIPISGNSPEVLARSFGRAFHAGVDDKRLLMEAWINEEKAEELGGEAAELISRVRANKKIEISTGAFIVLEEKKGTWNGVKYNGVWDIIIPDHLAILSDGSTGACSYTMGCGVRAAASVMNKDTVVPYRIVGERMSATEWKRRTPEERKAAAAPSLFQKFTQFIGAQAPEEMGDSDLRDELRYVLGVADPTFRYSGDITIVYPQNNRVVYAMYEPEGICYYARTYSLDKNGEATLNDDVVEVERVTTYEPVEPGDELVIAVGKVIALAGARHSSKDQRMVQNLHDTSVSLGADCATVKASEGAKPCGCGKNADAAIESALWE